MTATKDAHTTDFIYCMNPDCRATYQICGYIAVRCQECGSFFTSIKPDWDAGVPIPTTLVVIGCSKKKCDDVGEIAAHCRYTGSLFQAQLAYARTVLGMADADIYVASAKLGLIGINTLIPDYNLALSQLPAGLRRTWGWRVALALRSRNPQRIHFLAGKMYRDAVTNWMPGIEIVLPVVGLGYAQQVQWYKRQVANV